MKLSGNGDLSENVKKFFSTAASMELRGLTFTDIDGVEVTLSQRDLVMLTRALIGMASLASEAQLQPKVSTFPKEFAL